jgi:hypothetical protein
MMDASSFLLCTIGAHRVVLLLGGKKILHAKIDFEAKRLYCGKRKRVFN